jgi:hypothetical protein
MKWRIKYFAVCMTCAFILIAMLLPFQSVSAMQKRGGRKEKTGRNRTQQGLVLLDEKDSLTAAKKKIDSQLLYAIEQRLAVNLESIAPAPASIRIDTQGRVLVDIRADVTPGLLSKIKDIGGEVVESFALYHSIVARVPLEKLENLAALKKVRFISPAPAAITN